MNDPKGPPQVPDLKAACQAISLSVVEADASTPNDIPGALAALANKKVDVVVVKDVHVCCGLCQKAIKGLFKDTTVTFEEKGPQRTVRIEGSDLSRGGVLETLRKAGFNGTPEKK